VAGRGNGKYGGDWECIPIRNGGKPNRPQVFGRLDLKQFFDDEEIQNDQFSTGNKSVEAPLHV
jgi:hypothetical protein